MELAANQQVILQFLLLKTVFETLKIVDFDSSIFCVSVKLFQATSHWWLTLQTTTLSKPTFSFIFSKSLFSKKRKKFHKSFKFKSQFQRNKKRKILVFHKMRRSNQWAQRILVYNNTRVKTLDAKRSIFKQKKNWKI